MALHEDTVYTEDLKHWSSQTVLVTGCSGFIGGNLSGTLLKAGANVVGLSRNPYKDCYLTRVGLHRHERMTLICADLYDLAHVKNSLASIPVDAIFQCAGEAILGNKTGPSGYSINTTSTSNLLLAARESSPGATFLLASSDMVYGPGSSRPFVETMPPGPHNPYGTSKFESEERVAEFVERGDILAGVIRLSNVYGGGDMNLSRLVPGLVCQLLSGGRPKLRSDGQSVRDFLHIDDAVRGFLMFAEALRLEKFNGEVFNIASGSSVRVIDLVNYALTAAAVEDWSPPLGPPDRQADAQRHVSIQKAGEKLKWIPEVTLEHGIKQTFEWYDRNGTISMKDAKDT